jgi:hypothetical protein
LRAWFADRPIAYDLKLKAPAEQKEILFMSGQRFGELQRAAWETEK